MARHCSEGTPFPSLPSFASHLKQTADIAFPVIHGRFGEDGAIQVRAVGLCAWGPHEVGVLLAALVPRRTAAVAALLRPQLHLWLHC